jgi:serine/threonine-protein kinase
MSGSSSAQLPRAGDVIDGKYALERLLGQGGMGAVYAARHIKLGHAVAVKVMLADAANHEAAQRFVNEGRAAANIQNEHVVRVSDVDEENGYAYMILELLEGEDLAQLLEREGRLPSHVAVGYVMQALDGVRQAHAQGIVHRDLKPSNLFLAKRHDGAVVVKVLDFGISKANNTAGLGMAPGALTSTRAMLGSPLYMSPEQLRSSKSVDARADIWAIGIILYELITGAPPFTGESLGELFAAILETDAPLLRTRQPEVPPGVEAIVARCLQRRPEHRVQTVAELERELAPFASVNAAPASPFAFSAVAPSQGSGSSPRIGGWEPGARGDAGTGPHGPVVVGGTVPLGASTPQPTGQGSGAYSQGHPMHPAIGQTNSSWQSTGATRKSSNTGLVVALVCGAVAFGGIGLAAVVKLKGKNGDHAASSAASAGSTSAPVSAMAVPAVEASAHAPPVVASAPAEAAGAAPTAVAPASAAVAPRHRPPAGAPKPPDPPKAEPARTAEAPKPPVAAARPVPVQPAPTAGTLQGNR